MRRSDFYIKLVSIIVFAAVVVYVGVYLYQARTNPLRTVLAARASASESVPAEGWAVRDEQLISGGSGTAFITASDGQKIPAGGSVAVSYSSRSAAERSEKIRQLRLKLDALNGLLGGMTVSEASQATVTDLAYAVRTGNVADLASLKARTETYLFGDMITSSSQQIRDEIAQTERELESAAGLEGSGTAYITSPVSGIFTSVADGFERVSPADLNELTPEKLEDLFKKPDSIPAGTVGRVVTGLRWYFAAPLSDEDAALLHTNSYVNVEFSKTYSRTVRMRVEQIGNVEDGMRAVVLSSEDYMYDAASLRELSGEIIFDEITGIKVPREAIHIADGQTFVYVLVGLRAQRADCDILLEAQDFYIVEPKEGSRLAEGVDIIVSSGDIFDGKVVQ